MVNITIHDDSVFVLSFHWMSMKEHTHIGTPPVDNRKLCKYNSYAMSVSLFMVVGLTDTHMRADSMCCHWK